MLSVLEQSPRTLTLRVESDPALVGEARRRVEAFAAQAGFDPKATGEIGLCINEALANVIHHAYGDACGCPIVLTARDTPEGLEVSIRDWGCGRDPTPQMGAAHDPLTPGGLGLPCLRTLMDQVRFVRQKPGMLLTLLRRRQERPRCSKRVPTAT